MPTGNANPHLGETGKQEDVTEIRLEVILPDYLKTKVLEALVAAHPYEEVAYDVYRLENANQEVGAGMIGFLPEPLPAEDFIPYLKEKMNLKLVRHTPLPPTQVRKVAVCGGAGSFLIKEAIRQQADIFITADLKYHDFFAGEGKLVLADIGHYESEVFTKEIFYDNLIKKFSNFAVLKSNVDTNPVRYT
jgi:putative NIF3 family GTP cyclohydrolase 1 type 2